MVEGVSLQMRAANITLGLMHMPNNGRHVATIVGNSGMQSQSFTRCWMQKFNVAALRHHLRQSIEVHVCVPTGNDMMVISLHFEFRSPANCNFSGSTQLYKHIHADAFMALYMK